MRLSAAFAVTNTITYLYDFGYCARARAGTDLQSDGVRGSVLDGEIKFDARSA